MIKMDTHTKQMFFAGMFAYVTTVSGLIFDSKVNEAKQDERISHLESNAIELQTDLKLVSAVAGKLTTENAARKVMLETLNKTVEQLNKTTQELSKVAERLDERTRVR